MIVYKEYNRLRAVSYARKWALSRNPLFIDFTGGGGDCTNFVSQCIYAGSCVMNFTPDFGWYYITSTDRAPAWSSVEFFHDFITGRQNFVGANGGIGPFGYEVGAEGVFEGDVVQLADRNGDFYHTLIISGFDNGETLVCAHTNDALDRPLSSYPYTSLRYIHIEAVRIDIEDISCYDDLLNGISLNLPEGIDEVSPQNVQNLQNDTNGSETITPGEQ